LEEIFPIIIIFSFAYQACTHRENYSLILCLPGQDSKTEGCVVFLADFAVGFQEKVGGPFNDRREAFRTTLKTSKKWRQEKTQYPMIMILLSLTLYQNGMVAVFFIFSIFTLVQSLKNHSYE